MAFIEFKNNCLLFIKSVPKMAIYWLYYFRTKILLPDRFLIPIVWKTNLINWYVWIFLYQWDNFLLVRLSSVDSIAQVKHGSNYQIWLLFGKIRKRILQPYTFWITDIHWTFYHGPAPNSGMMCYNISQIGYGFKPTW